MRRTEDGIAVIRLHYTANPTCNDPAWIAAERRRYTSQAWWDLEMEIKYEALSGQRVYPEFDPAVHVIADSLIPLTGCRYMSIDPHPRTPHGALWVLIDKFSDWYVYRELWPSVVAGQPHDLRDDMEDHNFTIREYAETFAILEGNRLEWHHAETDDEYAVYKRNPAGWCPRCNRSSIQSNTECPAHRSPERIIERFMDQAGKAFRASGENQRTLTYAERYNTYGIQCADPYKSHRSGEDAIHSLLKLRRHDTRGLWPRLHIAASCKETILELQKYRYKPTKVTAFDRELKQEGVEARCHMIDNLRYLATANLSYIHSLVS